MTYACGRGRGGGGAGRSPCQPSASPKDSTGIGAAVSVSCRTGGLAEQSRAAQRRCDAGWRMMMMMSMVVG